MSTLPEWERRLVGIPTGRIGISPIFLPRGSTAWKSSPATPTWSRNPNSSFYQPLKPRKVK